MDPLYDRIGLDYANLRRPDPRIAAQIDAALGQARNVLNVGAGSGGYEPANRAITALEPSATMSPFWALGDVTDGLARLDADLRDGTWDAHHGHLRGRDTLDCGYRLVTA